jgi:uncharacterized delta-60 repeat protein
VRYLPDGQLDPGFGRDGKVVTRLGEIDHAGGVAVEPDEKIVVVGWGGQADGASRFELVRHLTDGHPDAGFGAGGLVQTAFGSTANGLAVATEADGKILAAGNARVRGYDFALVRYVATGELDSGFGSSGKVATDFSGLYTRVASLSATRTASGVLVRWRTVGEVGSRGFSVYRERSAGRLRVTAKLVAAKGNARRGASYSFVDRAAPKSARRYWLQETKRDGRADLVRARCGQADAGLGHIWRIPVGQVHLIT